MLVGGRGDGTVGECDAFLRGGHVLVRGVNYL